MADVSSTADRPSGVISPSFHAEALEILRETVGRKLLHDELATIRQMRDESLRTMGATHPDPYGFFSEHVRRYKANCSSVLQQARRALHGALDEMLWGLESDMDGLDGVMMLCDCASCRDCEESGVSQSGRANSQGKVFLPKQEEMSTDQSKLDRPLPESTADTSNSVLEPAPSTAAGEHQPEPSIRETVELSQDAPRKRRKVQDDDIPPGGLMPTVSVKRTIPLEDVVENECIFRYSGYDGFYILRCNRAKCNSWRTSSGIGAKWFREYPFKDPETWRHFAARNHGISNENEVFLKYAKRVIGATEERNLVKPESKRVKSNRTPSLTTNPKSREQTPIAWHPLSPISAPRDMEGRESRRQVVAVDDDVATAAAEALSFPDFKAAFKNLASPCSKKVPKEATFAAEATNSAGGCDDCEDECDVRMTGVGSTLRSSPRMFEAPDTTDGSINKAIVESKNSRMDEGGSRIYDEPYDERRGSGNRSQGLPGASLATSAKDNDATNTLTALDSSESVTEMSSLTPSVSKGTGTIPVAHSALSPVPGTTSTSNEGKIIGEDIDDNDLRSETTDGELPSIEQIVAQCVRNRQAQQQQQHQSQSQSQSPTPFQPLSLSQAQSHSPPRRNRRVKGRVDYREKPPDPEEFA